MSRAYDCVVFDLDGTILDSHDYTFAAFRYALAPWHCCPTDAQIHAAFGPAERVILDNFIGGDDVEDAYRRLQSWYRKNAHRAQPHPEIRQVLGHLQERGIANALFTGRAMDSCRMLLQTHGLDSSFTAIIAGDSPVQPKPAGEGVTALLKAVHCRPERSLVVGDSRLDILAATEAGVRAVGVCWFPRCRESRLEAPTLQSPQELLRLVLGP